MHAQKFVSQVNLDPAKQIITFIHHNQHAQVFMNMYEYVHAVMAAIIVQYKSQRYIRVSELWTFKINLLLNSLKDGPSKRFVLVLVRLS